MLLTNRLFEREAPSRTAKSIFIFCEGLKREHAYFTYFSQMDQRINIEVYKLDSHEDNSPRGLLKIAKECIIKTEERESTKYDFREGDEVWLVIDLDKDKDESRKPQIQEMRAFCQQNEGWHIGLSNPCFEVWLHYHHFDQKQEFEGDDNCKEWKSFVNVSYGGGFDSRKHPIFIQKANENARKNHQIEEEEPVKGCTDVFYLGESMFDILQEKINNVLNDIQ